MTKKKGKVIYAFVLSLILVGCVSAALNPKVGDAFDNDYLSDRPTKAYIKPDKNNFFLYQGEYEGGQLYMKNKIYTISTDEVQGGILVKKGIVVKTYNKEELNKMLTYINASAQKMQERKQTTMDNNSQSYRSVIGAPKQVTNRKKEIKYDNDTQDFYKKINK